MTAYYVVVEEWNYPTESGREVHSETYDADKLEAALQKCLAMAVAERENFERNIQHLGGDPQAHAAVTTNVEDEGRCYNAKVSVKSHPDLYYAVRLVKMTPLTKE